MRTIAALFLTTLLTMSAGCAQTDWIDRTLVTVDVTGAWQNTSGSGVLQLELKQQGLHVTGSSRWSGGLALSGPIEGNVAGDTFRFKQVNGPVEGEMTVSGDEMVGRIRGGYTAIPTQYTFGRVNPASQLGPPTR